MDSKTTVGPFGGDGGNSWDDGIYSGIKQIVVVYGSIIDSIHVEYDKNGQSVWSVKHGGSGGSNTQKVQLDFPEEYLTSISGYHTVYTTLVVIHSLTFQSNKRKYGPFGTEQGIPFSFPTSTGAKIVGFHGRSGIYLHSIGAHLSVEPSRVSHGPFGGEGGNPWNDGVNTDVRELIIAAGDIIDSICIKYDRNGEPVWSLKHGESDGGTKHSVKFDYDEFLVSISGYYGLYMDYGTLINALTFQTNKKIYGPFGREKGKQFLISSASREKIIGFHGRSGLFLDSIGAYIEPIPIPHYDIVGPYGGQGGNLWDDGVYTTVRQVKIAVGDIVDSICIEYDKNGQSIWSLKHGTSNGGEKHMVKLDYPDEFLVSISGYYDTYFGMTLIQSLTLQTNIKTYGPFGKENGNQFSVPSTRGKIIGFHGRSGLFLDSIGTYVQPLPNYDSIGPYGGQGGTVWDDGVYDTVRQLIIHGGDLIDSICIEYDKNGQSVWSLKHGESNGGEKYTVNLDYPHEFLVSISGYYGLYMDYGTLIHALTFQTNKNQYGPFGREKGKQFSISSDGGKIIGFHGNSGLFLDSIGAYVKSIPIYHYETVGPYGGHGGTLWDDGVYTAVRQVIIGVGDIVDSIHIEYDKDGQSVWGLKHGKSNGGEKCMVKLDTPNEFLVSISGYYATYFRMTLIHSLTLQTNKKTYGPFGAQKGCKFSTSPNTGKIVGFHGRSGSFLDSIGAHVETTLGI